MIKRTASIGRVRIRFDSDGRGVIISTLSFYSSSNPDKTNSYKRLRGSIAGEGQGRFEMNYETLSFRALIVFMVENE